MSVECWKVLASLHLGLIGEAPVVAAARHVKQAPGVEGLSSAKKCLGACTLTFIWEALVVTAVRAGRAGKERLSQCLTSLFSPCITNPHNAAVRDTSLSQGKVPQGQLPPT